MGAGSPNWQKLHEMGKLPKSARGNVPMLQQLDAAEKRIKELEAENVKLRGEENNPEKIEFKVKCEVEDCDFTAIGKSEAIAKNNLRLHSKTHDKGIKTE